MEDFIKKILEQINVSTDVQATIKKDMDEAAQATALTAISESHSQTWMTANDAIGNDDVRKGVMKGERSSYEKKYIALGGLTPEEVKDKKADEIFELASQKVKAEREDLKSQIDKDAGQKYDDLKTKYEGLETKYTGQTELLTGANGTIERLEGEHTEFKNGIRLSGLFNEQRSKIKLIAGDDAVKNKVYFDSELASRFDFKELDGDYVPFKKGTEERPKSATNTSKFLTSFEVMDNLASELKVKQMSDPPPPGGPKPPPGGPPAKQTGLSEAAQAASERNIERNKQYLAPSNGAT